ncbi:MAG: MerR family redox-sensitive transcriptional activator SoxR [Polaribacter sp.]|jgi:MerR family redox-sensitive transcriptional activator SoxR
MSDASWSVGLIAERCGVKVSTLHFYEKKGLIKSWRNSGNQRRYKADVMRRIAVIKAAQKVGIDLKSIKSAIATLPNSRTPSVKDWEMLGTIWRDELNEKISYMEKLRDSMSSCIGCGCLSLKKCPLYNKDDKLAEEGSGAVILDRV